MKRIFAKNVYLEDKNTINKNELIVGTSGSFKTGSYVTPLVMTATDSFVVCDTKMNLYRRFKDSLESRGFKVYNLNLVEPDKGIGYDPLDFVRYEVKNGKKVYSQKDIITLSSIICPVLPTEREPFWTQQAQMLISILIAYVLDEIDGADKNLASIVDVFRYMSMSIDTIGKAIFMEDYGIKHPDSFGAKRYQMISSSFNADKTWSSIKFIAANALQVFEFDSARTMLTKRKRFNIKQLGKEKTALFLNISDTDRSLDALASIFYTQALNVLCTEADKKPNSKLDVPVRLCLDDFASNAHIPDFEKIVSVVRSRDISVSCIIQSISQLCAYYGQFKASTIIDNMDTFYYLGGQDLDTANYISKRANIPLENVLELGCNKGILFRRGDKPLVVTKLKPYSMMPDNNEHAEIDENEPEESQPQSKS